MGGDQLGIGDGTDALAGGSTAAPAWDRFAHWPRTQARFALLTLILLLLAAALAPISAGRSTVKTAGFVENIAGAEGPKRKRDDDLALYDRAIERIRGGESYYDFIVEEQRRSDYPVTPGLAVRLPTLAYLNALFPKPVQTVLALALMLAVLTAWWRRFGDEAGGAQHRKVALSLLFVGASLGLNRYYFELHELWCGMLIALSFGLHRSDRWGASLAAAALAVAIREHALPFILLMAAAAAWRRDTKQALAWSALAAVFLTVLAVHLQIVAAQTLPSDRIGPDWFVMRGLSGWLSNVALSSNLRFLPGWLAGPMVILMVFGWAGWRSAAGAFGAFLYLGYGLAFMIAGRADNFYWGAVIAPAMFIGLAFVPRFLISLASAAFQQQPRLQKEFAAK